MNKLREKFEHEILTGDELYFITLQCEQITDDFSIKLLIWLAGLKNGQLSNEIDFEKDVEEVSAQLQQYFKENVYNK